MVYGGNHCHSHDRNGTAPPGGLESLGVYNLRKGKMRPAKHVVKSTGSKGIIQFWSERELNILWRARGGNLDMWSLVLRDFWGIRDASVMHDIHAVFCLGSPTGTWVVHPSKK
ncbi:hypothetical protein J3A83DRAFT_4188735 [Scleroderma citrinum]